MTIRLKLLKSKKSRKTNNCKIKIETLDSNKQPIQTVFDERVTEGSVLITPAQYFNKFNGLRITIYSKTSVSNVFGIKISNFMHYNCK